MPHNTEPSDPLPLILPWRRGLRPDVTVAMPHAQVSQSAPSDLREALFERAAALPHVTMGPGRVSVPGARRN